MGKIYHTNSNQKKAGVAPLVSDRANLKPRKVYMNKERHYVMMKGSILQKTKQNKKPKKTIIVLNVCTLNAASNYMRENDTIARRNEYFPYYY